MSPEFLRKRESTPSHPSEAPAVSAGLPQDLLERAARRLGLAALIYASVYTLAYGSARLTQDFAEMWGYTGLYPSDFTAAAFIGLSVALFLLVRSCLVHCERLLQLGLVYEVIGATGIEIGYLFFPEWPGDMKAVGLSWTCVWIVIFPLLVPTPPGKTFLAALATATVQPLMYGIAVTRGLPPLPGDILFTLVFPTYICVGIAVIGARVVYGLGSDIGRARRLGSYELVEKLGTGGMGEVWKARHRMLVRPAAIKLIHTDGSGSGSPSAENQLQRFEREVQATALLHSPHTVHVYDYGRTEDRTFYYVMELLDGVSLDRLVKGHGPLPPERVVHILRQVCHSLAEAHAGNLVHRDIKPANIFVCRYGREYDFTKVLDFGLVKRAGAPSERDLGLTQVGTFVGTPAFGSPEMASAAAVDGRSDIYSLGCVGFFLLTGRTVFKAPTVPVMLVKHLSEEPHPPSKYARFAIPSALDDTILECLRKDRAARPASVEVLDKRLAEIPLDQPWSTEQARAWWDEYHPPLEQTPDPLTPPKALTIPVS